MMHLSRFQLQTCLTFALLSLSMLSVSSSISAQTSRKSIADEEPLFHEYRGVKIGWLSDEVRKKLGEPANKGDEQDFYIFNEKETAQILYDKAHKVITISVDFSNGAQNILTPQQVFGAEIDSKADGSKYRLVRYPKAGYWLSYSRTAGDSPIITVTLQKLGQ